MYIYTQYVYIYTQYVYNVYAYVYSMYIFIFEHTSARRVPLTLSDLNKKQYSNEIVFRLWNACEQRKWCEP